MHDLAHDLTVVARLRSDPQLIARALGSGLFAQLRAAGGAAPARRNARTAAVGGPSAREASSATPGQVYTGLGFDACSAPSASDMSAWGSSSYRAIGVYIGGTNRACSQPNLTASWVGRQSAAGWHLIPIYVGLQAPQNSCGCAPIKGSSAAAQGTSAAKDAVVQAESIGLGAGNPIIFDMEGYSTGPTNSQAVLSFLQAWTRELHAEGYLSGVYSSSDSGVADLAAQWGTGYAEPDELWAADWNGRQDTYDPNEPSGEWASHQRLHQYDGAHDETHGGVTINIDGDYLDAPTAAGGSSPGSGTGGSGTTTASPPPPPPGLTVVPQAAGPVDLYPSWSGGPPVSAWQLLAGPSAAALAPVGGTVPATAATEITSDSAYPYFSVQALDGSGQVLAASPATPTPSHLAIFGHSAFVPPRGLAGVPVGCFSPAPCHVSATLTAGGLTLARTGPEYVGVGGGLVFFSLTPHARALLLGAAAHALPVQVTVRSGSLRASTPLNLIGFTTSGRGPRRSISQDPPVRILGTSDFVASGWAGGILAECLSPAPCLLDLTLTAGGTVIAHPASERLGANRLGYLPFTLTPAGHALLAHARGNQLGVQVSLDSASGAGSAGGASAQLALISFRPPARGIQHGRRRTGRP